MHGMSPCPLSPRPSVPRPSTVSLPAAVVDGVDASYAQVTDQTPEEKKGLGQVSPCSAKAKSHVSTFPKC